MGACSTKEKPNINMLDAEEEIAYMDEFDQTPSKYSSQILNYKIEYASDKEIEQVTNDQEEKDDQTSIGSNNKVQQQQNNQEFFEKGRNTIQYRRSEQLQCLSPLKFKKFSEKGSDQLGYRYTQSPELKCREKIETVLVFPKDKIKDNHDLLSEMRKTRLQYRQEGDY